MEHQEVSIHVSQSTVVGMAILILNVGNKRSNLGIVL